MSATSFPTTAPTAVKGASPEAAISAVGVGKVFQLPRDRRSTIRERVVHPLGSGSHLVLEALRDVSFEVPRGEFFGIVGRNGSGKSTLLRCLASIYRLDAGDLRVEGRVAPFIELGVGFNHQLAAHDNMLINAVLLGLSPAQARERFADILAFAELGDFADLKLKNYSAGMSMRLAFSVTVQVDADVLLFDEVLAVGDVSFQEKCFARFARLKAEGRTVVLVTHDMDIVERFCDRALLLHHGRAVDIGEPGEIARGYRDLNAREPEAPPKRTLAHRPHHRERGPDSSGPVAFGTSVRRVATAVRMLAVMQFKLRYLDSVLSYFWAVMQPIAMFLVLYGFATLVGGFNRGIAHYPVYLLMALVLWTYFEQSSSASVHSLVGSQSLLRTLPLPRVVIPLAVVLSACLDLCMNFIAVVALLLASGITPRLSWLELPVLVALLSVLCCGSCTLLSALYVRFRDVNQIWLVLARALFFGTPVFYVASALPDPIEHVMLANPLAAIITEARHALVDPGAPTAAQAIGGPILLLIPLAIAAGVLALGLWVCKRESPWVAENL